jgi:LacI family transcriptional regulator
MIDVARAAGVSLGTVSNVVNNPAKVTPTTRQKVEAAIAELGFVRNGVARSLRAGRSTTIGFVLVDLGNSFFLDLVRGAEEAVTDAGMNLLLANADMSWEKEQTYLALFEEERVAGILLTPRPVPGEVEHLPPASAGVPRVLLNDPAAGPDVCSVVTDNERGGYLAARHLIETGRRRLLFAGTTELEPVRHRYDGALRAVREAGGAVYFEHLATDWVQVPDGRQVAETLLRRPADERPDGVLAGADLLALGLIQTLAVDGRLRVPQDIAVVGYDNNRAAWDSVVPITTLDQAGEEMGRAAAALLLEEIQEPATHQHRSVLMEPFLVARESSVGR